MPACGAVGEPVTSDLAVEEVNDRFGVESTLTDLQKDRQWDAFEGKCVEWTGELSSLSEGFFGGFSIQFKHLPTTFVSDVLVSATSSEESQLLQWREGQRYTYRATLKRYGGAILPTTPTSTEEGGQNGRPFGKPADRLT